MDLTGTVKRIPSADATCPPPQFADDVDVALPGHQQPGGGAHVGRGEVARVRSRQPGAGQRLLAGLDDRLQPDVRGLRDQKRGQCEVEVGGTGDLAADVLEGVEHTGAGVDFQQHLRVVDLR